MQESFPPAYSKQIHALGLMSGTSLDGLDIGYFSFVQDPDLHWHYEILQCATLPYSDFWEQSLRGASLLNAEELLELNTLYGRYLAQHVKEFVQKHSISKIDVVASHGHTVLHNPKKGYTLQIGDGRAIKLEFPNCQVVYDFRMQDVLLGGNGAPLVPIGDAHLFSNYQACLNLGGFSNISFQWNDVRAAFDISPVNTVLNHYASQLGHPYDKDGTLARTGNLDLELLARLDSLEFYTYPAPKSLGMEWVEKHIFPLLSTTDPHGALTTFTHHCAGVISRTLVQYDLHSVLVTGGGAYNSYLVELIKDYSGCNLFVPEAQLIEYKEALIFAFMGVLRMHNINNVLASATGAQRDHSTGLLL